MIKYIRSKLFHTHELQKNYDIDVQQNLLNDNVANLFTKTLPTFTFKKLVYEIEMCRLKGFQ